MVDVVTGVGVDDFVISGFTVGTTIATGVLTISRTLESVLDSEVHATTKTIDIKVKSKHNFFIGISPILNYKIIKK